MKQLLILSGKGGTGKTTVASAFIKLANAKAYADCDVDAPNLHLITEQLSNPINNDYYGLPKAIINYKKCVGCGKCLDNCRFDAISLADNKYIIDAFACEGCGVCKAVCISDAISMEDAVAGELMLYNGNKVFSTAKLKMGSGTSGKLVARVKTQLIDACKETEFAIIDGSPGIGCPVIASLSGADIALIVAEPSLSGISDMQRIIKTANFFDTRVIVCVNKYDTNIKKTKEIEKYCLINNIPYAGKIPYDNMAVVAINSGKSIVEMDCPSKTGVTEIYDFVIKKLID